MEKAKEDWDRAINRLWLRRTFPRTKGDIVVAVLIRYEDWGTLDAPWWKKKEVSIIGADLGGNFLLRHSDGSVRYWDHATQTDEIISPSVREFAKSLL